MSRQGYAEGLTYVDDVSGYLRPADQSEVFVYKAGTTELASIYESRSGGTLLANPFVTGDNGMAIFWAVDGEYDIKVHDTILPARFGDYKIGWQSSPVKTQIGEESLDDSDTIGWKQELSGAWVPDVKYNSIDTPELKDNSVTPIKLHSSSKPLTWYTPKVIATEETRENTAYGTLTTPDEISGIVVPENGMLLVRYVAHGKSSVSGAGSGRFFLNNEGLKDAIGQESFASTTGTGFRLFMSSTAGLVRTSEGEGSPQSLPFILSDTSISSGFTCIAAPAGTHSVSTRWKASSGSITLKARRLYVAVLG